MCLVCFINAEESRMKNSYKININHTDNNNNDNIDDNDDKNNNETLNNNHNISIISSNNNIDKSIDTLRIEESHSLSSSLTAIHYFAIGSMTNVTSIALRELSPINSKPGILRNHRLLFRGSGMRYIHVYDSSI